MDINRKRPAACGRRGRARRRGPGRADSALTGQMAAVSYLLGAPWNCTANVPAMGDMPAHTDHLTVAFDVAPHNTMHDHVTGADYMGDDYYGSARA